MNALFQEHETILLDGAMGTELIKAGLQNGEASILWNALHPEQVLDVHRSYVDSGSICLTANTFGGSRRMMDRYGLGSRFEELNWLGARIALQAAAGRCKVLGDIGPCGDFLEPLGDLTEGELVQAVEAQGGILADAGVAGFVVETMSDPNELATTVSALKIFGLPILASYTFERSAGRLQTMMSTTPIEAGRAALEAGADAIGANCGTSLGLRDYLELARELLQVAGSTPVMLQPNAGTPVVLEDGGFEYRLAPGEFGEWALLARSLGVRILGGCCGTTPDHIASLKERLPSFGVGASV